ncbi:9798_t:CDS:2 [Entrophospora sp. SA101]|nr:9798_t:CDS:2 [Entrophospora sp. SA101]
MKTTRSGRPFVKDIHDLFSTLVVSLPMETHRNLFKNYSNSFTTEEAIANLGSLRFTQSHRTPDPKDPSRIVTTTTTTTFSMTKEMAKSVCQTFMDARLFENLGDSSSRAFKDKNIYGLTQKGQRPNVPNVNNHDSSSILVIDNNGSNGSFDRNLGIEVKDRQINQKSYRYTFTGASACDWLCEFTTLITKEEAMKIAIEFIRYGFIECKSSTDKTENPTFRYSKSTYYQILEKGGKIASWNKNNNDDNQNTNASNAGNVINANDAKLQLILDDSTLCKLFMEFLKANFCAENLMFLLDVQKFKRKYKTLSNENIKDQQELLIDAFKIYHTYLAEESPDEVNIDHGLRQNVIQYMTSLMTNSNNNNNVVRDNQDGNGNILAQIKTTSHLYDKIQDTIFRLMATDSIPKFIKTDKYLLSSRNKFNNSNDGGNSEDHYHRNISSSPSSTNGAIQC